MYRNQFNNTDLSGQTGNIIRWESSTDNFTTDTDIANTTTTLTATNLTTTTQYRARTKWCLYRSNFCYSNHYCRSDFGGEVLRKYQCVYRNQFNNTDLSGQTGNIIRWESSTDNFTTDTDIANTTTTLTATNLTTTAIPCNRTKWCLYRSNFCYSNHYCRSDFGGGSIAGSTNVYRNQFNNTDLSGQEISSVGKVLPITLPLIPILPIPPRP
ncbi:hypothetical protein HBA12_00895 [Tenacibaculum mesophilum]|uniref:hypothetical protein n=1 Tax=Tenacibaculum mesophilum TaxID=104268 RepID=UPI0014314FD4|nr:hypothetical protein [Tenacibaculum mesophilum]KAF9658835.1 hypothetical protein HBA12_00895 [Tenacibaculum mesophilum]